MARSQTQEAVLYARVSTKDQEREGFSIPAQRALLQEYSRAHGMTIREEFIDVETAKQAGRASFGRMLAFFRANPTCRTLLVEKTDRAYRNPRDWVSIDDLKLTIHFVTENVVLTPDARSSEKFMHGIKVLMAKNYIDNLSEEVRKGLNEKVKQGHFPGVAHVGYVNNRETRRIDVDPVRGPLVARVFQLYATGEYSLTALTRTAYEIGLRHSRSDRRMTKSEIHRMLTNPIYTGDFRWLGKIHHGSHEPLISHETFAQVQAVLGGKPRPRLPQSRHAFRGLLRCGRCGCRITAETKKGRYAYYRCTGFRGRCGNTYIREEQLAARLGEVIARIQIPPAVADRLAEALRTSQAAIEQTRQDTLSRLAQRRQKLHARLDRAYDDLLDGRLSEALWTRKSAEWEAELATLDVECGTLTQSVPTYVATGQRILELAKTAHFRYLEQSPAEQRRLLEIVLSNCTFDRGSVCPTYAKPFDLLVQGNETGNWLGGRDSNPETRPSVTG